MGLRFNLVLFIALVNLVSLSFVIATQAFAQGASNRQSPTQLLGIKQASAKHTFDPQSTPQEIQERFNECGKVGVMNASHSTLHDIIEYKARMDFAGRCGGDTAGMDLKVSPLTPQSYIIYKNGFIRMTYIVSVSSLACSDSGADTGPAGKINHRQNTKKNNSGSTETETSPATEVYEVTVESFLSDSKNIRCDYKSIR